MCLGSCLFRDGVTLEVATFRSQPNMLHHQMITESHPEPRVVKTNEWSVFECTEISASCLISCTIILQICIPLPKGMV